ncbi:MAG: eCIS core domain-containing protein [Propionicimonas sp.]
MLETVSAAHRVRAVGNAVNLSTVLGLGLCWAGRAKLRRGPDLLLLAEGYRLALPKASAFTVGNVVLFPRGTADAVESRQPGTLAHEAAHTWQYFGLLGLPFLPAYAVAAGWSWLRTGNPASANWFERNAGLVRGGYTQHPIDNAGFLRLGRAIGVVRTTRAD